MNDSYDNMYPCDKSRSTLDTPKRDIFSEINNFGDYCATQCGVDADHLDETSKFIEILSGIRLESETEIDISQFSDPTTVVAIPPEANEVEIPIIPTSPISPNTSDSSRERENLCRMMRGGDEKRAKLDNKGIINVTEEMGEKKEEEGKKGKLWRRKKKKTRRTMMTWMIPMMTRMMTKRSKMKKWKMFLKMQKNWWK